MQTRANAQPRAAALYLALHLRPSLPVTPQTLQALKSALRSVLRTVSRDDLAALIVMGQTDEKPVAGLLLALSIGRR